MPKMVRCKFCGEEIPKSIKNCPRCGRRNRKRIAMGSLLVIFGIFLIFIAIGDSDGSEPQAVAQPPINSQQSSPKSEVSEEPKDEEPKDKQAIRDDYIEQCEKVKYSDVERNPDDYDGKKVKITGKVIQVSEGLLNRVTMRIDCDGNTWLVSYRRSEGESRILENDKITCYGECTGVTSYITVLGSSLTLPSMNMKYYD